VNIAKGDDGRMRVSERPVAPYIVPMSDDELKGYHRLRIAEKPDSRAESRGADA
jgi:hypothetical protein